MPRHPHRKNCPLPWTKTDIDADLPSFPSCRQFALEIDTYRVSRFNYHMNQRLRHFARPLLLAAAGAALLPLCSCSTPKPGITKVKSFHLVEGGQKAAADQAIPFEYKHYMHGAITSQERRNRQGNYYTVMWKLDNPGAATIRLEYRQGDSRSQVKSQEVPANGRRGTVKFEVNGADYQTAGKVTAWKITLSQGGSVVGSQQSFLWE